MKALLTVPGIGTVKVMEDVKRIAKINWNVGQNDPPCEIQGGSSCATSAVTLPRNIIITHIDWWLEDEGGTRSTDLDCRIVPSLPSKDRNGRLTISVLGKNWSRDIDRILKLRVEYVKYA